MTPIVDLDSSLSELQPWPEVAETLYKALQQHYPRYDGVTITLRTMGPADWGLLLDNGENPDGSDASTPDSDDSDDRHFEFVFDIAASDFTPPPDRFGTLRDWVELIILDRVDKYLEAMEKDAAIRRYGKEIGPRQD